MKVQFAKTSPKLGQFRKNIGISTACASIIVPYVRKCHEET